MDYYLVVAVGGVWGLSIFTSAVTVIVTLMVMVKSLAISTILSFHFGIKVLLWLNG